MALPESKLDRKVYKLPRPAAKRPHNFIFEELKRILRSIDFRDVIEASKHVVKKQQT